jgi:hypothetical protein
MRLLSIFAANFLSFALFPFLFCGTFLGQANTGWLLEAFHPAVLLPAAASADKQS